MLSISKGGCVIRARLIAVSLCCFVLLPAARLSRAQAEFLAGRDAIRAFVAQHDEPDRAGEVSWYMTERITGDGEEAFSCQCVHTWSTNRGVMIVDTLFVEPIVIAGPIILTMTTRVPDLLEGNSAGPYGGMYGNKFLPFSEGLQHLNSVEYRGVAEHTVVFWHEQNGRFEFRQVIFPGGIVREGLFFRNNSGFRLVVHDRDSPVDRTRWQYRVNRRGELTIRAEFRDSNDRGWTQEGGHRFTTEPQVQPLGMGGHAVGHLGRQVFPVYFSS